MWTNVLGKLVGPVVPYFNRRKKNVKLLTQTFIVYIYLECAMVNLNSEDMWKQIIM